MSRKSNTERGAPEDLSLVLNHPYFTSLLRESGATTLVGNRSLSPLDVAVVKRPVKDNVLLGTSYLGYNRMMGIIVPESISDLEKKRQEILRNDRLRDLLSVGQVATLFRGDGARWRRFYDYIEEHGYLESMGDRVLRYSGLRYAGKAEVREASDSLDDLLTRSRLTEYMDFHGVQVQKFYRVDKDTVLDRAFVKKGDNELTSIPLHYIRRPFVRDGAVVDVSVVPEVETPGFILPAFGTTERDSIIRAEKAKKSVRLAYPNVPFDQITIFESRQARLSHKLPLTEKLRPYLSQTNVDLEALYYLLYLGNGIFDSGAFRNLSLPPGNASTILGTSEESIYGGYDVLLLRKDSSGRHSIFPLNVPLWGLNLGVGDSLVKPVENVAALAVVPDHYSKDEARGYTSHLTTILKRHAVSSGQGDLTVAPVNSDLVKHWKNNGLFPPKPDMQTPIEVSREVKLPYAMASYAKARSGVSQAFFVKWINKHVVGGGVEGFLVREADSDHSLVMLNMGDDFGSPKSFFDKPPAHTGILSELRDGDIPMLPGALSLPLLYTTGAYAAWQTVDSREGASVLDKFVRSELAIRGDEDVLKSIMVNEEDTPLRQRLQERDAEKIFEQGLKDAQEIYGRNRFRLMAVLYGHAHADHVNKFYALGNGSVSRGGLFRRGIGEFCVGDEVNVMTPYTRAFLSLRAEKGTWASDVLRYVHSEEPYRPGHPYKRDPRNVRVFQNNGEVVQLGGGISVEVHTTNHSVPGSAAYCIRSDVNEKGLLVVGDVKNGPKTSQMIDHFAGRTDIGTIVIETTNGPDSIKPVRSSDDLARTYERIFETHSGLVVVAAASNNPDRLKLIYEAAQNSGRPIVVASPEHITALEYMVLEKAQSGLGADIFNGDGPYPNFPKDVKLFHRPGLKFKPYETAYRNWTRSKQQDLTLNDELFGMDVREISYQAGRTVLVVSPYDAVVKNLMGLKLPKDSAYVHGTFRPYSRGDQSNTLMKFQDLRRMGFDIYAQFSLKGTPTSPYVVEGDASTHAWERLRIPSEKFAVHESGHNSYPQMRQLIFDLLDGRYAGRELVLVHGVKPEAYAHALGSALRRREEDQVNKTLFDVEQDIRRTLGHDNPEALKIVWRMSHYDPRKPFNDPNSDKLFIRAFSHEIR